MSSLSQHPPQHPLRQIEKVMKRNRIPPSRFGREAAGDPQLVFDLRRGRTLGAPLIERISRYIQNLGSTNPSCR